MASLIPSAGASGTGSMTLQGPNTNSNQTVTIPDATGTVMVSGNMPAFSAYLSTNQSISASTWTKIQINTKLFDTNSNYDNSTNFRFTPTVAGYYQINACLYVSSTGNNPPSATISVYKNGSSYAQGGQYVPGQQIAPYITVNTLIYFNGSTDYVEFYARYESGGTGTYNFTGGQVYTYVSGSMVRSS